MSAISFHCTNPLNLSFLRFPRFRAWSLRALLKKARIHVPEGAFLLGVVGIHLNASFRDDTNRRNKFVARLLERIICKSRHTQLANMQRPEVEPLDAFVASMSDEELSRQLIIDSKTHIDHILTDAPRYA